MNVHAQNKALLESFFVALGSGDSDTLAALLSPDAKAIAMGTSMLSGTRDYNEIVTTAKALMQMAPAGIRFDVLTTIAEGDRVVAEVQGTSVLHTGTSYNNQYCFVATCRDGQITELHEYFCTKLADEALLPALPQPGPA